MEAARTVDVHDVHCFPLVQRSHSYSTSHVAYEGERWEEEEAAGVREVAVRHIRALLKVAVQCSAANPFLFLSKTDNSSIVTDWTYQREDHFLLISAIVAAVVIAAAIVRVYVIAAD